MLTEDDQAPRRRNGNVWTGLLLLGIGGVLLLDQFGIDFPWWMFKWYTFMIVLGIFIGLKHAFRDLGWLIVTGIGVIFLLQDIFRDYQIKQFAWPIALIGVGLIIIFKPKKNCDRPRRFRRHEWRNQPRLPATTESMNIDQNDVLDIVSIFGSIKKNILSKNFRGGEIVSIFGGAEVNLTQSDIPSVAELEIVQIFGGTKLIIPSNWNVRSEAVAILGGVEDKRDIPGSLAPDKTLIIKGTTIFGGIDIVSYA